MAYRFRTDHTLICILQCSHHWIDDYDVYSTEGSSYCPIDGSTLIRRSVIAAAHRVGQRHDKGLHLPVMNSDDPVMSMNLAWNCWCTVLWAVSADADRQLIGPNYSNWSVSMASLNVDYSPFLFALYHRDDQPDRNVRNLDDR